MKIGRWLSVGVLISVSGVSFALPAAASDASELVAYGDAAVTCRAWLDGAKDSAEHLHQQQWLLGFFSGYNLSVANNEQFDFERIVPAVLSHGPDPDPEWMTRWMDGYCSGHPEDTIATAALRLVDEVRMGGSGLRKLHDADPAVRYSR